MIYFIAAIDNKRGMATEDGIPWDLPSDKKYFREQTSGGKVLMGYGTYIEFDAPLPLRENFVAARAGTKLKPGFIAVENAQEFLENAPDDIWVIGGAKVFADTIHLADELYLTQIEADYHATKFFPEFENKFKLFEKSDPITENGVRYRFNKYRRLP